MLGLGYSRFNAYHDTDADDSLVIMTGLVMSQPPPLPPDAAAATAPYPQPATFGRSWTHAGCPREAAGVWPTNAGRCTDIISSGSSSSSDISDGWKF